MESLRSSFKIPTYKCLLIITTGGKTVDYVKPGKCSFDQVIKVNINNGRQTDSIYSWSKNCTSPQWSFSPSTLPGWIMRKESHKPQPRHNLHSPAPVPLPGESHGQWSLAGHGPRGRRESDMTEATEHARRTVIAWPDIPKTITCRQKRGVLVRDC